MALGVTPQDSQWADIAPQLGLCLQRPRLILQTCPFSNPNCLEAPPFPQHGLQDSAALAKPNGEECSSHGQRGSCCFFQENCEAENLQGFLILLSSSSNSSTGGIISMLILFFLSTCLTCSWERLMRRLCDLSRRFIAGVAFLGARKKNITYLELLFGLDPYPGEQMTLFFCSKAWP